MRLRISSRIELNIPEAIDLLLQIEPAHLPEQTVHGATISTTPLDHFARIVGTDGIGERVWLRASGAFSVDHRSEVAIDRVCADLETLEALPLHLLPGETVPYLMDSLYCPGERFRALVESDFPGLTGGAAVVAMRDWIASHLTYAPATSDTATTALDSYIERRGVCRDYAHVMISLARAAAIPARYASVYAPGVDPQDFHAVAEVFLASPDGRGGLWHLVDPTGMADARDIAKIGIGRDAADASFLTYYGALEFVGKWVEVEMVG